MATPFAFETVRIICTCPLCKIPAEIVVDRSGYDKWQAGAYVQVAFPEMSADQREQLISGTCSPCWDTMWNVEEDDDND